MCKLTIKKGLFIVFLVTYTTFRSKCEVSLKKFPKIKGKGERGMGKVTSFTPEEVKVLEARPSAGIQAAIEATGNAEAVKAFEQYVGMFNTVHDTFITLSAYAMSAAYKAGGADFVAKELAGFFRPAKEALVDYWSKPFKERVGIAINMVKCCHDCVIEVVGEDDEKLTFRMDPCGSGQMLWDKGVYGPNGPCSLCAAHNMTAGCSNFPIYCIHAPLGEIGAIEQGEVPFYQQEYPEQVGPQSCLFHVYKNKEDVPESYFTRVGLKRP